METVAAGRLRRCVGANASWERIEKTHAEGQNTRVKKKGFCGAHAFWEIFNLPPKKTKVSTRSRRSFLGLQSFLMESISVTMFSTEFLLLHNIS